MTKDATEFIKKQVLRSCVSDSVYYYYCSLGTEYEDRNRNMLTEYWKPFYPQYKDVLRHTWWYYLARIEATTGRSESCLRFLVFLVRIALKTARHNGPLTQIPKAFLAGLLRVLTQEP